MKINISWRKSRLEKTCSKTGTVKYPKQQNFILISKKRPYGPFIPNSSHFLLPFSLLLIRTSEIKH